MISFCLQECYNYSKVLFLLCERFHWVKVLYVGFNMFSKMLTFLKCLVIIGWKFILYPRFPVRLLVLSDCTLLSQRDVRRCHGVHHNVLSVRVWQGIYCWVGYFGSSSASGCFLFLLLVPVTRNTVLCPHLMMSHPPLLPGGR